MKKLGLALIILLILGVTAVVTCPDKEAHKDAITKVINEVVQEELGVKEEDNLGILKGLANIGAGIFLESKFSVDNYFVCSVGRILYGAENEAVSLGVFGHVFTFSKENIKEYLH